MMIDEHSSLRTFSCPKNKGNDEGEFKLFRNKTTVIKT